MLNKNPYIQIIRPLNVIITISVIIVAAIISIDGSYSKLNIFMAAITGGFTAASGNIINDYFDIEIDKINRPERPLPSKKISIRSALNFYLTLVFLSVVISFQINFEAFLIVVITQTILFLYSFKLKNIVLIGNITVSFLAGFAFIFGGIAVDNYIYAIIPAVFAFLITLIRELIKDIEDIPGDDKLGIKTLPIKFGVHKTKHYVLIISSLLILCTFYPFITVQYKIEYFLFVMVIVNPILVYVLKSLFEDDSSPNLNKLSFILKLDMIFGLTAIFLGK
jgi:geranylgeranylglycerol-phosphate geranylgeranyltransferase